MEALFATTGPLEVLVAEAEGTAGAIAELRDAGLGDRAEHLALRDELDWATIADAHAEAPFDGPAAAALAARPDCPGGLRFALFAAEPAAVAAVVPRLTEAMAVAALPKRGAAKAARVVARRAVTDGLGATVLLERMRPAAAVLESARLRPDDPAAAEAWDEFAAALAKLVEARLGADPAAWSWVRARLNAFPGTVTELLDAAGAALLEPAGAVAWPESADLPELSRTSVTGVRAAYLTLFDRAPAATQLGLLDTFDDRTVFDLFTNGRWRDEWTERAVTDPRRALRLALAARLSLPAEAAGRLARLDDPAVNAQVFRRAATPHRLRMRLLAGDPLGPGRAEPVPLDAQLRAHLLTLTAGWHGTDPLDCADQELQRHIIRHVRVRGKSAQFRLLLNLWHRHGAAAVADLLAADIKPANYSASPITPAVRNRVQRILDIADEGERQVKLDALEAEIAAEESPEGQFALLRAERTDHTLLFRDSRLWDWDAIVAEHRREPLPDAILATIDKARGCPEELVEAGRSKLRPWESDQEAELVDGRPPEEVLATPREGYYGGWIGRATAAGVMSWGQVLRHGVPAALPLDLIGGSESPPEARAALAELLAEVWDGNLEAIVLAIGMLTGFPGPPAELLHVATAVVAI
ncbi:hypothetical protein [Dactylosporangium sp. CA-233914]|uniref:hypothetical protein n=1 Tax=Dactylosporangium sp. CA-233914 TaxID=3239934 RepID=UPI003D8E8DD0